MGFFSRLFGSRKRQDDYASTHPEGAAAGTGQPFYTNAPAHWPRVTDEFLRSNASFTRSYDSKKGDSVFEQRMFMVNSLVLLGKINEALAQRTGAKVLSSYTDGLLHTKERYATSICIEKLFAGGIIKTNGVVLEDAERYAVFLFTQPVSAAYVAALRQLFVAEGCRDLVYYSTTDPDTVPAPAEIVLPFESLNKACFTLADTQGEAERTYRDYAMWWSTDLQNDFKSSAAYAALERYYDEAADCYTYLLGKLGTAFGTNDDDTRNRLPDYDEVVMEGPEGVQIILSISQSDGINFHFPAYPKFERYRDHFLTLFADFAHLIKQQIVERRLERDPVPLRPEWFEKLNRNAVRPTGITKISLLLKDSLSSILN